VEKPLTATIREGRRMVEVQKETGRVAAVGLNRRGNPAFIKLAEVLGGGALGNLCVGNAARISNLHPDGIGKQAPADPPEGFDWDMWLGPRAHRPYRYNIAPYKFRWYNEFSSQVGNWGVHYIDAIRWMMGERAPCAVSAHGSKLLDHDADIMDTMSVTFEFASRRLLTFQMFESCGGAIFPYGDVEIRGSKGVVYADERTFKIIPAKPGQFQEWKQLTEPLEYTVPEKSLPDGSSSVSTSRLIRDFLDCVKTRKTPLCPLEEGHRSTSFAHLANIAVAVKQRLEWDADAERFTNCEKANERLHYDYRAPWKLG
jgi:predicted dehydrogenase